MSFNCKREYLPPQLNVVLLRARTDLLQESCGGHPCGNGADVGNDD